MNDEERDGSVRRKLLYIMSVDITRRARKSGKNMTYTFPTQRSKIFRCAHSTFPPTCPRLNSIGLARCRCVRHSRHDDGNECCHCRRCHTHHCRPLEHLVLCSSSVQSPHSEGQQGLTFFPVLFPATTKPIEITSTVKTIQEVVMVARRPWVLKWAYQIGSHHGFDACSSLKIDRM